MILYSLFSILTSITFTELDVDEEPFDGAEFYQQLVLGVGGVVVA